MGAAQLGELSRQWCFLPYSMVVRMLPQLHYTELYFTGQKSCLVFMLMS